MVAEAEVCHQSICLLDARYRYKGSSGQKIEEIVDISASAPPVFQQICPAGSVSVNISCSDLDLVALDSISDRALDSEILQFFPSIRSGSFADIGHRQLMEDEHIRIDDLSAHFGSTFRFPLPSAFYGVFDGHGGPDAATYIRRNALRFLFEDADFPQSFEADDVFLEEVESSVRRAFLNADLALADDCSVSTSSGTTVLTALIFGRLLLVANAGDCRAVLCRNGEAFEMSQDHRPISTAERNRVEESGGFIDDGYLNGMLSVTRALGDWDMKFPKGSPSPLIADPEFRQVELTEDDEFLIIGCDGIWDRISSQDAVRVVRRCLRRHDNPELCAKELVKEALLRQTSDNLTAIVVCFSGDRDLQREDSRLRCCRLRAEALCSLKSILEGSGVLGE